MSTDAMKPHAKKSKSFMPLWFWLAFKELLTPFTGGKCDNRWDFIKLIFLLSLIMTLTLFAIGTHKTLLNNFTTLLLGKLPDYGIPIWVNSNSISSTNHLGINDEDLQTLAEKKYKFHPYEEVSSGRLRLSGCLANENNSSNSPACSLWSDSSINEESQNNTPPFLGIAIFNDDPLWQFAKIQTPNKNDLIIILDKSQFKKYFNFDEYITQIKKRLPKNMQEKLPISKEEFYSNDSHIWMSLGRVVEEGLLVSMKIKWVKKIPIPGKYSFLLPMNIYQNIEYADKGKINSYHPEAVKGNEYVKELSIDLYGNSEKEIERKANQLLSCIKPINAVKNNNLPTSLSFYDGGDQLSKDGIFNRNKESFIFSFSPSKPRDWINACLKKLDLLDYNCTNITNGQGKCPFFYFENLNDETSYQRLINGSYKFTAQAKDLEGNDSGSLKEEVLNSFYHGFLYVDSPELISQTVDDLKSFDNKPFRFHEMYEDTLKRFDILQAILNNLSSIYQYILFFLVIFMLWIKISIIIEHREKNYDIYLKKGMQKYQISFMLTIQIIISSLFAVIFSILSISLIRYLANNTINHILIDYQDFLIQEKIDLLPLVIFDYLLVLIFSIISSSILIYLIITRKLNYTLRRAFSFLMTYTKKHKHI